MAHPSAPNPNRQIMPNMPPPPMAMAHPPFPHPPPGMPGMPPMPMQMPPMPMPMQMQMAMPPMMPNGMAPGMPPMPFPPMPGMFPPNMMFPGMKKGKGPQPIDKWANVAPNNTIYVNNLNEKTSRDETVNGLREVFGQFGKVLDVVCYTKIKRCKGQAWVVMEKTESATKAIHEMRNFIFFNKPMRVSYSKSISDATLKRDGKQAPQRQRPPKKKKKKKIVVQETIIIKKKKKRKKSKDKTKKGDDDNDQDIDIDMKNNHNHNHSHNHNAHKEKKRRQNNMAAPNKTLFLQNLPKAVTSEEMHRLFIAFPGFRGVNLIENKPGIGFAEFDDTYNSSNAQRSLNGFTIHTQDIIVEFAQ